MFSSEKNEPPLEKIDRRKGPRSDEVKAKIREGVQKGWERYKKTDDFQRYRKTISESKKKAWKNREHNSYGLIPKRGEETKRKMSESHKRMWRKINDALKQMEEKEKDEATK